MSDTHTNIADSARAGNDARRTTAADFDPEADAIGSYDDAVASIVAAVRNGTPVPTSGYFASGRGPAGEAARLLIAYSERDILDLIGGAIGPPYPVGSASRWHRRAGSVAEKRVAECIASIVHGASGADPLARRVAIVAARAAAGHAAAPLTTLTAAAFGAAVAELEHEIADVAGRLTTIRQHRTRAAISERRAAALPVLRQIETDAARLRRSRRKSAGKVRAGRLAREAFDDAEAWAERVAVPAIERALAEARVAARVTLTAGQRRRLAEFADRLRRLRAARRALRRALRDLCRVKGRLIPAAGIAAAASGG